MVSSVSIIALIQGRCYYESGNQNNLVPVIVGVDIFGRERARREEVKHWQSLSLSERFGLNSKSEYLNY